MRKQLKLSFVLFILMVLIMRWQGSSLITDLTPKGILDLEFAKTSFKLLQLQQVWKESDLKTNIYLDFLFILTYTWFFVIACYFIKYKVRWMQLARYFILFALAAGIFDVVENILMLSAWFDSSDAYLLEAVYYCAIIKFILISLVLLFLLAGFSFGYYQKKYGRRRSLV